MATVTATVIYEFEVPELDEVETDDEYYKVLDEIKENWSWFKERDGYTAWCEEVSEA